MIINNIFVKTITFAIVILGMSFVFNTQRQRYPNVIQNKLSVVFIYPERTANEIEDEVVKAVESEVSALPYIESYDSRSFDSVGVLDIVLKDDGNVLRNKDKLRFIISSLNMPNQVQMKFWEWIIDEESILDLAISSKRLSMDKVREYANRLKDVLEKDKDVTSIEKVGYFPRVLSVELTAKKMQAINLRDSDVIGQIQRSLVSYDSATYNDREKKVVFKVGHESVSKEMLENIDIFSPRGVFPLKDIADVKEDYENRDQYFRVGAENAIVEKVRKTSDSDLITVVDRLKKKIDEFSSQHSDIHISYVRDTSLETRNRLDDVLGNIYLGFLLIIVVLFLTIRFGAALWVIYSMSISCLLAFVFFYFFDVTINAISLVGIVIVSGMLIDDAVVVTENAYRHRFLGNSWEESAYRGVKEILMPIVSSTFTKVVAFIPLYFLKGDVGKWAKEIPLVVVVILISSLIQSVFLLPGSLAVQGDKRKTKTFKERRYIIRAKVLYQNLLKKTLTYPKTYLSVTLLLTIFSFYYLIFMKPFISYPDEGSFHFTISGYVKNVKTGLETKQSLEDVENFIESYPKDLMYSSFLTIGGENGASFFSFDCLLVDIDQRKKTSDDVIEEILDKMKDNSQITDVDVVKDLGGLPEKKDFIVKILDNNDERREALSNEARSFFRENENVKKFLEVGNPLKQEITFAPDEKRLLAASIQSKEIVDYFKYRLQSKIVYVVDDEGEPLYIKAKVQDEKIDIDNLSFRNVGGKTFFLKDLGSIASEERQSNIFKENGQKLTRFQVDTDSFFGLSKLNKDFRERFSSYMDGKNQDTTIVIDGKLKENELILKSVVLTALIALTSILVILIFTFKSLWQSLIISFAIPFSMIGVAFALLTHNAPVSYMALFGIIGLWGVVVNNTILLVNVITEKFELLSKSNINVAIIQACRKRFRPIVITSLTTIAGLFPTAYKLGGKDYFIVPTAVVMSWGMLFSTIVALFIVPIIYSMYHERLQRKASSNKR